MKPFEERYTAWVDGRLSEDERIAFERELPDLKAAEADRESLTRLSHFLRTEADSPKLPSADFFNYQLQQRMETERVAVEKPQKPRAWSWSSPRWAWAAATCMVAAGAIYQMTQMTPSATPAGATASTLGRGTAADDAAYFAEIVDVRTEDPNIYASTVYTPSDNVTVLWLEGLDYLPASYALQN
jgi:anti-sigma factor RsiW